MTGRHPVLFRIFLLGAIVALAALALQIDEIFGGIDEVLAFSESVISRFPTTGMLVFVLLASVSAMLAFFSSALLVPIGIYTWGAPVCFLLLWTGWLLGGVMTFAIGYWLGRPVTSKLLGEKRFLHFEKQMSKRTKFVHILLLQSALPSEIPGYVLGTLHYRFRIYLVALAIAELPYALGTVYLGSSFIERNWLVFLIVGLLAVLISVGIYQLYRRNFHNNTDC